MTTSMFVLAMALVAIAFESHNGLFVALALGVRVGPMPKNVSEHGANHRRPASPSTRRAIDRRDRHAHPDGYQGGRGLRGRRQKATVSAPRPSSLLYRPGSLFNRAPSGITIWP
jgi:hypothetical protein